MQLRWSKRPPITSPWQAPTEIVKSSIFSQSQRRNLILQCGALVFWKISHFSSESCGPYLIRILSQGKPSGGQRFTGFAYSEWKRRWARSQWQLVCDISICLLIGRKVGESSFVFCVRTGQEHRGVDCVRQAIVIWCQKVGIRAMGHKTHSSEREDWTQTRGANTHSQQLVKSGKGRDKRGKDWHQVRLLLQLCKLNPTQKEMRTAVKQRNDYHVLERQQQVCYTTTTTSYVLTVMYVLLFRIVFF